MSCWIDCLTDRIKVYDTFGDRGHCFKLSGSVTRNSDCDLLLRGEELGWAGS